MIRFEGNIMKSINAPTAFFMGIILLGAASCTMKQAIQLDGAGGGSVAVDIELADYLTDVIDQVQALLQPEKPLRDEEAPRAVPRIEGEPRDSRAADDNLLYYLSVSPEVR